MRLTTFLLVPVVCATAMPATFPVQRSATDQPTQLTWTFQKFQRQCTTNFQLCVYTFNINENDGQPAHPCQVSTLASNSTLANHGDHFNLICGAYNVNSHWNNTFGNGQGFTNLTVVRAPYIAYPAYTDTELDKGIAFGLDHAAYPVFLAGV